MNKKETVKIIAVIKSSYPHWAKSLKPVEIRQMVETWNIMLEDYEYSLVANSIKSCISTSKWPPSIAEVIEQCQYIQGGGKHEMTEQEAWHIVSKSISNSTYHSEEEFEKLPDVLKSVVGGPWQLRTWAIGDVGELETVIASNFMRSYRTRSSQVKKHEALPNSVKDTIQQIAGNVKMIE